MKLFLSHSSYDSPFVIEVAKHLKRWLEDVSYHEEHEWRDRRADLETEISASEGFVTFAGKHWRDIQTEEVEFACQPEQDLRRPDGKARAFVLVRLDGSQPPDELPARARPSPVLRGNTGAEGRDAEALRVAREIAERFGQPAYVNDDLPANPYVFGYEKNIISYFIEKAHYDEELVQLRSELDRATDEKKLPAYKRLDDLNRDPRYSFRILPKQLAGCPANWPTIQSAPGDQSHNDLPPDVIGSFRGEGAFVVAAALSEYHCDICMDRGLGFPEAGPREFLSRPEAGSDLKVAILVSGGIAPGTNAVIDGITERHHMYADQHHYKVEVIGIKNGFQAFDWLDRAIRPLQPEVTREHMDEGGSLLGTSRFEELRTEDPTTRRKLEAIDRQLSDGHYDILYIIGGDGSLRAAHAIWNYAREHNHRLSVVGIPKTMDNDILWVWQTFGFLSAVERAREMIAHLSTEVTSNPRLGVVQLFGSDSGFVVSNAVLASKTGICDAALIPEVDFSMMDLATYLKDRMTVRSNHELSRIPSGFVVLGETAIPVDAEDFFGKEIGLSDKEKAAVRQYLADKDKGIRIVGQTDDALRTAGLKIVSDGLKMLLPAVHANQRVGPDWSKLRVVTNEPRHLLRATPPATVDIINGQRLGLLAVDAALAGYTDFMVSQWLTEFVLVPLKLTVLGRKRIPTGGIFWKSVIAKTGQPADLTKIYRERKAKAEATAVARSR